MPFADLLTQLEERAGEEKPSTIARLGLSDHAVDSRYLIFDRTKGANHKPAVDDSDDLQRILALPRRPRPNVEQQRAMAAEMTERLRLDRNGAPCDCAALNPGATARGQSPCITSLLPVQGWYLYEAAIAGGALGFILVGGGKTGIDILLPMVVPGVKTYVLMLPPSLVDQFKRDYRLWSQHFRVPNLAGSNGPHDPTRPTLRILKYSELSRPNFSTWLSAMSPCAFGFDEAQALKDLSSVRTDRLIRYFESAEDGPNPKRVFTFAHSGSLTTRGIEDYTHLAALTLREGSPVPLEPATAVKWGQALNPAVGRAPAPMGALRHLCAPGERLRAAFQRRLVETLGVITTEDSELDVKLRIRTRDPGPLPKMIETLLEFTRQRSKRPDGEELVEKVDVIKVCRQLAAGFFYRWRYPHVYDETGNEVEPDDARLKIIDQWFGRQQSWARELREKLERRSDNLDSPKLLEDAARRHYEGPKPGEEQLPKWPALQWAPWRQFEPRVEYEKDTVWLDDFLVNDARAWMREAPGVVWYLHRAFGERLATVSGAPTYCSKSVVLNLNPTPAMLSAREKLIALGEWKENAACWLGVEDGTRPIVCSLKAFHFGVNLQSFRRMLVCNPPSDGGIWEQTLGRLHRTGQPAEAVDVYVYRHTEEVANALEDAKEYARYSFETTGKAEKLLYADYLQSETVS